MSTSERPLLLLIDGSHAVYRAYHAIRGLRSPSGVPSNAVYGFTSMLLKLMEKLRPARLAVCFDGQGPGYRSTIDPEYKANRPPMPDDLRVQWPVVMRITEELGFCTLLDGSYEADDVIATLATQGHEAGMDVIIVSGDKDLMQLVVDASP